MKLAEKDDVLDEVIRKNSELAQENKDLVEEIDLSVLKRRRGKRQTCPETCSRESKFTENWTR